MNFDPSGRFGRFGVFPPLITKGDIFPKKHVICFFIDRSPNFSASAESKEVEEGTPPNDIGLACWTSEEISAQGPEHGRIEWKAWFSPRGVYLLVAIESHLQMNSLANPSEVRFFVIVLDGTNPEEEGGITNTFAGGLIVTAKGCIISKELILFIEREVMYDFSIHSNGMTVFEPRGKLTIVGFTARRGKTG